VVIHPERSTSPTAAISASSMLGRENGRNSFRIYPFFISESAFFFKTIINTLFS
jgi:hypothetical protein